jgi:Clp amino terminal domain, pathogenicity island component/UvrB/uvrC motif
MFERFTDRARRVVVLAQEEARVRNHDYIGTEHILLGLIREGDGVAAQVLVMRGAALDRVRQQVVHLLHGHEAGKPGQSPFAERELGPLRPVRARLEAVEQRLAAIEQRVGTGPGTSDLDEQIEAVRAEKEAAIATQDFAQAASLRNREKELLASRAARREQWAAGHPALPVLAERCQQLAGEVERLRGLLREHGIDPQDKPA